MVNTPFPFGGEAPAETPEDWVVVEDAGFTLEEPLFAVPSWGSKSKPKKRETGSITTDDFLLKGDEKRYNQAGDVSRRLSGTFVRFEDEPVYVYDVFPDLEILLQRRDQTTFRCHSSDSRLDISSVPLGFINTDNGQSTYYVERAPHRQQTQGVHPERMSYYCLRRRQYRSLSYSSSVREGYFRSLLKEFPTISTGLSEGYPVFAFSRTWALLRLKRLTLLYYKANPVGFFDEGKRVFFLHRDYATPFRVRSLNNILSKQYGEYYEVRTA